MTVQLPTPTQFLSVNVSSFTTRSARRRILGEYKKKNGFRMLEIGVFRGSSTKVWEDYFEGGDEEFFGLGYGDDDFNKKNKVKYGEKTTLYYGDQSDRAVMEELAKDIGAEGKGKSGGDLRRRRGAKRRVEG